jgi:hypothetical protein
MSELFLLKVRKTCQLAIKGPFVYGPLGVVIPESKSPEVCIPSGSYIRVISGGTCILTYSSPESVDYLASDTSELRFEITRIAQSINFTLPSSANVIDKSIQLSATASSGLSVTYQSLTPTVCAVIGNALTFLKGGNCQVSANQAGSATIAPVLSTQSIAVSGVAKVSTPLICLKGKKVQKVLSKNCPKGYKPKK